MSASAPPSGSPPRSGRSAGRARASLLEIRRAWRSPEIGRKRVPHLGPLRLVAVIGARIDIALLLVRDPIELGEGLDDVAVRIVVIGVEVVPGPVPADAPGELDLVQAQDVAGAREMAGVVELPGGVEHAGLPGGDEVHRMMVDIAAQEHEEIPQPVGQLEAELVDVEPLAGLGIAG